MGASPALVAPISALPHNQMLFCTVELDAESWGEHIAFLESQKIKTFIRPEGFEWQWDGTAYGPVKPGEQLTVPYAAAQAGYRRSAVFPRELNATGQKTMSLDHMGERFPMLRIVDTFDPTRRGLENAVKQNGADTEKALATARARTATLEAQLNAMQEQMKSLVASQRAAAPDASEDADAKKQAKGK